MSKTVVIYDTVNDMRHQQGVYFNNVLDTTRREDGSWTITVADKDGKFDFAMHIPRGKLVKVVYNKPDDTIQS